MGFSQLRHRWWSDLPASHQNRLWTKEFVTFSFVGCPYSSSTDCYDRIYSNGGDEGDGGKIFGNSKVASYLYRKNGFSGFENHFYKEEDKTLIPKIATCNKTSHLTIKPHSSVGKLAPFLDFCSWFGWHFQYFQNIPLRFQLLSQNPVPFGKCQSLIFLRRATKPQDHS